MGTALAEWMKAAGPALMTVAAVIMAINQWVHRRERKEISIDTEMHGKPARIEILSTRAEEREKSQDLRERDRDEALNRQFEGVQRDHCDLRDRCFGDSSTTIRGRLHVIEDWRQDFGGRTEERLKSTDKELARIQRQLDRDWRRTKGDERVEPDG